MVSRQLLQLWGAEEGRSLRDEGEGLRQHFEACEEALDEVPPCKGTCRYWSEFLLQRDVGWLADDVSGSQAGGPGSLIWGV